MNISTEPAAFSILKTPKTRSSIRKVWIPKTVAELLLRYREWQLEHIQKLKEMDDERLMAILSANPELAKTITDLLTKK